MNWQIVLAGLLADLAAAPTLSAIYGSAVRLSGAGVDHLVPSIDVTLIADTENELWAPATFQIDLWNSHLSDVVTAESFIRSVYHAPLPIEIGGLSCFAQYTDGTTIASPERDGYYGRALRFTFTPLRAAYTGG